ncbi:MAG: hypothetical protein PUE01_01210 [Clostridiaceae bacterium]|nr:hypothetical protein [Clostridiaceae bacterium]
MQYLLTVFLIFLILFLVSFVTNLFEIDKKLDDKMKSKYAECINEIILVSQTSDSKSDEENEETEISEEDDINEELILDSEDDIEETQNDFEDEIEDEEQVEEEEKVLTEEQQIDIEEIKEKKKKKFENEIISISLSKAFDDMARSSGLLLLAMGIMSLVLQGISILLNDFDYTVQKSYVLLLTTFFLIMFERIVINPIVISLSSDILAHSYLKQGIEDDKDKMKEAVEKDRIKIDIVNFIVILIVSFAVYFLMAIAINLGNNIIIAGVLSVLSSILYKFMFKVQYE